MKNLYLILSTVMLSFGFLPAQLYNVAFAVDMRNEIIADTVSVAGNFQLSAGYSSDWTPGITILTDPDMDSVYTLTVQLPAGTYEYKFINGTMWGQDESVPGACQVNGNRGMIISGDVTLPKVCFSLCDSCPVIPDTVTVTFSVDMSDETVTGPVSIAGDFQGPAGGSNWTPGEFLLTDPNFDNIYELTLDIPEGSYQYKFLNGTTWGTDEVVPPICAVNNNRQMVVEGPGPQVIPTVCFGQCSSTCPGSLTPVNVTFRVNMANETVSFGGVYVSGSFQDPPWVKDVLQMDDSDGNQIFEYTYSMVPISYVYKYFNGSNGDPDAETANFDALGCGIDAGGFYARLLDLTGLDHDTILPIYDFNACLTTSLSDIAGAGISFAIVPNPTEGQAQVFLDLPQSTALRLTVTDLQGRTVAVLREGALPMGSHKMEWTPPAAGMYFIRLEGEGFSRTLKAVVR